MYRLVCFFTEALITGFWEKIVKHIHLYVYILYACIHAYIHTYVRTYSRTYIQTYVRAYVHTSGICVHFHVLKPKKETVALYVGYTIQSSGLGIWGLGLVAVLRG